MNRCAFKTTASAIATTQRAVDRAHSLVHQLEASDDDIPVDFEGEDNSVVTGIHEVVEKIKKSKSGEQPLPAPSVRVASGG